MTDRQIIVIAWNGCVRHFESKRQNAVNLFKCRMLNCS